jgi:hypothetical protein
MTGYEAHEKIEQLKEYQEALNKAISMIDEPCDFGSTYPASVLKEIVILFNAEQIELAEALMKVKVV